jgi:uncharacterized protein (DUF362 family)
MRKITRREFLRSAGGVAAGYGLARQLGGWPAPAPVADAAELPLAAVAAGTNADSAEVLLKTALEAIGGISRFVKPGQVVAIKPNATWDYPAGTASSTDPELLRALILLVRAAGAGRIIVVDHPTLSAAAQCLKISGIGAVLDELQVEKVFPDGYVAGKEYCTTIDLPKGKAYQKIGVLKAAAEADVRINMAVAKSHVVLPVTLCLKHMMGFLANPPALHAQLEQGITDINGRSAIQAQLHILEAIRVRLPVGNAKMAAGNDNEITNPKRVKRLNQIVAGTDPVLIDSYACINYFGYQPKEIRYVKLAGEQGLGETDVKAALADGRLRLYKAGQPIATPTAAATATLTATPTESATPDPPEGAAAGRSPAQTAPAAQATPVAASPTTAPTATPAGTNTPLPTATPELVAMADGDSPAGAAPTAGAADPGAQGSQQVINPNRLLSGALIPAAAVVAGTGAVIGRRLHRQEAHQAVAVVDENAPDVSAAGTERPAPGPAQVDGQVSNAGAAAEDQAGLSPQPPTEPTTTEPHPEATAGQPKPVRGLKAPPQIEGLQVTGVVHRPRRIVIAAVSPEGDQPLWQQLGLLEEGAERTGQARAGSAGADTGSAPSGEAEAPNA